MGGTPWSGPTKGGDSPRCWRSGMLLGSKLRGRRLGCGGLSTGCEDIV